MITVRNMPERKGQDWMRAATHCVNGHAYDETNTGVNSEGWRWCRTCNRERKAQEKAA